ncbi:WD40-repeat-containing domain protein [Cantharellus anzutake]|uniref:WD40-repeat-containing domain protein n=1 Tax=Cantharellus anzutake TaxID=1750568 RepID=UPI0019042A4B|nr:WD40-repeat-containing domain protein [Cantharellus anzutake]KAF8333127.1 WD40-repeat-containing domain protein [Cantharellus anzutake]
MFGDRGYRDPIFDVLPNGAVSETMRENFVDNLWRQTVKFLQSALHISLKARLSNGKGYILRQTGKEETSFCKRKTCFHQKTFCPGPSTTPNGRGATRSRPNDEADSEEIASGGEDEGNITDVSVVSGRDSPASEGEDELETPAEKRLRLAQLYLESVKESLAGEVDAGEIDKELIASRLNQEALRHSGRISWFVGNSIPEPSSSSQCLDPPVLITRGHRFTVTSAVVSEDAKYLYTSGKEGSIIKWDIRASSPTCIKKFPKVRPLGNDSQTARKKGKKKGSTTSGATGHTNEVLSLALSSDGKYLASAGKDGTVGVWDVENDVHIRNISDHRNIVSDVKFRNSTHTLYTSSYDRTIKVFSISPSPAYVETLFGHQDCISSLDTLASELAVSAGGMDKTVRYWKIADQTQLVFHGGRESKVRRVIEHDFEFMNEKQEAPKGFLEGRVECVAMLDNTLFLSGGDSGAIVLWLTTKKRPLFTWPQAHGFEEAISNIPTLRNPRCITALGALPYSELFASGSWDSVIRIWKLEPFTTSGSAPMYRSFSPLRNVHVPGFINSLQILRPPIENSLNDVVPWAAGERPQPGSDILLVAGVGQEPRLGRWMTMKQTKEGETVKNASYVFILNTIRKRTSDENR